MKNKEMVISDLDKFIKSENKNCLVVGTDIQNKLFNILNYLNRINKKIRILIRINSMQNSEVILKYKAKTGVVENVENLNIYVDSMQSTSQKNTLKEFNCILVYPIGSLKGMDDYNIEDILNNRDAEKIFWISNQDNSDYSYLKEICNIKHVIEMNNSDDIIHNRVLNNKVEVNENYDRLYVDRLSYHAIEDALSKKYNMGGISSSSMSQELIIGTLGKYTFRGKGKSKDFSIKVLEEKENDKYVLLVKETK